MGGSLGWLVGFRRYSWSVSWYGWSGGLVGGVCEVWLVGGDGRSARYGWWKWIWRLWTEVEVRCMVYGAWSSVLAELAGLAGLVETVGGLL